MRKVLLVLLLGFGCFLLGAACLFGFFRFSPATTQTLLGTEGSRSSSKPIVSALQLPQNPDAEEAPTTPPPTVQRNARPRAMPALPSPFDQDDADFFGGQDPFEAARKLHQQMQEEMRQGFAGMQVMDGASEEITEKEDAHFVSYEIKGVEGSSLNTSVQNGFLTIRGESKRQGGGMTFQTSFQRSFSLPRNVDATKMETISEKDKVVLKFPKKS